MPSRFRGKVRYFRPEKASGLAVIDIPPAATSDPRTWATTTSGRL
jgi:hypothetical protein